MVAEGSRHPSVRALALLPSVGVLGIAVLYATGAILKTAQIKGARVQSRDALPLFPLPELLATGIGTFVRSLALLLIFGGLAAGAAWWLPLPRERRVLLPSRRRTWRATDREAEVRRHPRWSLDSLIANSHWWLLGPLVVGLLGSPVLDVMTFLSSFAAGLFLGVRAAQGRATPSLIVAAFAAAFLAILAVRAASEFVSPAPLPDARVATTTGEARGLYLTTAGGFTYLASRSSRIVAIPDSKIRRISLTTRARPHPRRLIVVILDIFR